MTTMTTPTTGTLNSAGLGRGAGRNPAPACGATGPATTAAHPPKRCHCGGALCAETCPSCGFETPVCEACGWPAHLDRDTTPTDAWGCPADPAALACPNCGDNTVDDAE